MSGRTGSFRADSGNRHLQRELELLISMMLNSRTGKLQSNPKGCGMCAVRGPRHTCVQPADRRRRRRASTVQRPTRHHRPARNTQHGRSRGIKEAPVTASVTVIAPGNRPKETHMDGNRRGGPPPSGRRTAFSRLTRQSRHAPRLCLCFGSGVDLPSAKPLLRVRLGKCHGEERLALLPSHCNHPKPALAMISVRPERVDAAFAPSAIPGSSTKGRNRDDG